jgi:hypothetical protein
MQNSSGSGIIYSLPAGHVEETVGKDADKVVVCTIQINPDVHVEARHSTG